MCVQLFLIYDLAEIDNRNGISFIVVGRDIEWT